MAKTGAKVQEISGEGKFFDIMYALKNLVITFLVSIILLFLTAVAATYVSMPDSMVRIAVIVVTGICLLFTGFRSARHGGRGGLVSGIIAGLLYVVILYCIGCAVSKDFGFTSASLSTLILGITCGGLGGIIGVNTKHKKKRR